MYFQQEEFAQIPSGRCFQRDARAIPNSIEHILSTVEGNTDDRVSTVKGSWALRSILETMSRVTQFPPPQ